MPKERKAGIDVVKAIAVLFVICIHQIGNTHIMGFETVGVRPIIILFIRYTVMACVPLFLIISGYLQSRKTVGKKFYKGIIPVITSYLFISVFSVIYNMKTGVADGDIIANVISVFNFTANNYAWYVEMFIGLFLLIPFINIMYAHAGSKRNKLLLLGILTFLTIGHSVFTVFNTGKYPYDVLPDYWIEFYPVTYYLIGAYIYEYKPKLPKLVSVLGIIVSAMVPTVIVYAVSYGGYCAEGILNGFYSLSSMGSAVFVFLLFYDADIKAGWAKFLLASVAASSLDIYLFSNLTEKILYPLMPFEGYRISTVAVMVALVFASAFVLAKLKKLVFAGCSKVFKAVAKRG